jgi:hypothetical protein
VRRRASEGGGAVISSQSNSVARRIKGRTIRAAASLRKASADAKALGANWEWLANDLRNNAERVSQLASHLDEKLRRSL